MIRRAAIGMLSMCACLGLAVAAGAIPIPSQPASPVYVGHPAKAHAVTGVPPTPRNPFMSPNGKSEIHNDAWQTDAYRWSGPLGRNPQTLSSLLTHDCGSITFDTHGRVVS